jgi:hypothetical protein
LSLRLTLIRQRQSIQFRSRRRLLVDIAEGHRVEQTSLTTRRPQLAELPPRVSPKRLSLKPSLPPSDSGIDLKSLRLSLSNGSLLGG